MEAPSQLLTDNPNPTSHPQHFSNCGLSRRRRTGLLCIICALLIVGIGAGIVFVANHYYVELGGQGSILGNLFGFKPRSLRSTQNEPRNEVYLHVRPAWTTQNDITDQESTKRSHSSFPFYTCGDQQKSCAAYNEPLICCPVGMTCQSAIDSIQTFSSEGVYCCNSTGPKNDCTVSAENPLKCAPSTFECSSDLGGGCCNDGTACSRNGCIEFDGSESPPPITSTYMTTTTSKFETKESCTASGLDCLSDISTGIIITFTVTQEIGGATTPTATILKQGAVAQKAEAATTLKEGWKLFDLSCYICTILCIVAFGMALL